MHHGRWGFWKCFHRLRDQGHVWNHKKVHRVYRSMKLKFPRRAKKPVFTRERVPLLPPTAINQMWALDFMHDSSFDGRKFRLLNVIDEANREALRMECGNSFPAKRLVRAKDRLIDLYGKPRVIRMDNGPEMIPDLFVSWAYEHGIELNIIQPDKPNQNAYVEYFNKSMRTEVLNAWLYHSLEQAQRYRRLARRL
jgi:putative transposase